MNLDALKKLIGRGWNLIPLAANSKVPPAGFELSKYFHDKYPYDQILKWNGNVGVITGKTSGIAVIDIDDITKIDKYMAFNPGIVVETPSGGRHLYFAMPDVEIPKIRVLESGVEFYAGDHMCVVPPSRIEGYSRGDKHYSGDYTFIRFENLGVLPEIIIDMLNGDQRKSSGKYSQAETKAMLDYAFKHGRFEKGAHNDAILYGSIYLLGNNVPIDAVRSIMLGFDSRDPSPQGEEVVNSIVTRAQQYAKPLEVSKNGLVAPKQAITPQGFNVVDYGVMAEQYYDHEVKWLIDGWLLESGVMMIAAPPERFKTWLAIEMALSIAMGVPFLDTYAVNRRGKVLVVQQEDFGANLFSRFKVIEQHKLDKYPQPIHYKDDNGKIEIGFEWRPEDRIFFHPDGALTLDRTDSLTAFAEQIEKVRPDVVIIDPFYSLSITDDYYATAAAKVRQYIKPLREKYGCAFVFIHHSRKGGKDGDGTGREMVYGSTFVNAVMEGVAVLAQPKGSKDGEVVAYRRFKDAPTQAPVTINFDIGTTYNVSVSEGSSDIEDDILEFLTLNGPTSLKDLYEEFSDNFSAKPRLLEKLKSMSEIVQNGRRQYLVAPVVL